MDVDPLYTNQVPDTFQMINNGFNNTAQEAPHLLEWLYIHKWLPIL